MPNDFAGPRPPEDEIPGWRRDLDPDYQDNDVYRETFLQWLTDPKDLATVRASGQLLFSMALNYRHGPVSQESWRAEGLRSVARDLRHLKNYLRQVAYLDDDEVDAEDEHWGRQARKLAKKLGTIEEHLGQVLKAGAGKR
jgi:hypothetical protein